MRSLAREERLSLANTPIDAGCKPKNSQLHFHRCQNMFWGNHSGQRIDRANIRGIEKLLIQRAPSLTFITWLPAMRICQTLLPNQVQPSACITATASVQLGPSNHPCSISQPPILVHGNLVCVRICSVCSHAIPKSPKQLK